MGIHDPWPLRNLALAGATFIGDLAAPSMECLLHGAVLVPVLQDLSQACEFDYLTVVETWSMVDQPLQPACLCTWSLVKNSRTSRPQARGQGRSTFKGKDFTFQATLFFSRPCLRHSFQERA